MGFTFKTAIIILAGIFILSIGINWLVKLDDFTPYIGPVVAMLVAFLTVFINLRLSLKNRRIEWLKHLNDEFSQFFATLSERTSKNFEFYKHRTSLELLLDESKAEQKELLDWIDKVGMKINELEYLHPETSFKEIRLLFNFSSLLEGMVKQMKVVMKIQRKKINTWI